MNLGPQMQNSNKTFLLRRRKAGREVDGQPNDDQEAGCGEEDGQPDEGCGEEDGQPDECCGEEDG